MRTLQVLGLGFVSLVICARETTAQNVPGMNAVACPQDVTAIATCYAGKLPSGAFLLAGMPKTWNGGLVVHAHGGPAVLPPTAEEESTNSGRYLSVALKVGYAWIGSTYRREGYGAQFAAEDVDESRRFFLDHFPKPRRTVLFGTLYGGLVATMMLDRYVTKNPDGSMTYDGVLMNSGAVAGALANYEFRADLRAVYQYYCHNLPRPDEAKYAVWQGLPADSRLTQMEINARIDECTGVTKPKAMRSPEQAKRLADVVGVVRIPEEMLVRHMQAATLVFRDIVERISNGRSVFSNIGVRYRGSSDDAALNAGVERFAADPAAVAALTADGIAEGRITVPVISIHSLNDPQVPVEAQWEYRQRVAKAGRNNLLVQAYTDETTHAQQSAPELGASLTALRTWMDKGTRPTPEAIRDTCEALKATTLEGPCRWRPEFQPKSLNTRFARGTR